MELFAILYRKLRCWVFWRHATPHLWVRTIAVFGLRIWFCSVGTVVLPFIKCSRVRQSMWSVPKRWSNLEEARAPFKSYYDDWVIWYMGNWFYGPVCEFSCNEVYTVAVDYVSKWVESIALPKNAGKSVTTFLKKNIFSRFGTPRAIISDGGSHFCNNLIKGLFNKYGAR